MDAEVAKALISAGQVALGGLAAAWLKSSISRSRAALRTNQALLAENIQLKIAASQKTLEAKLDVVREDLRRDFKALEVRVQVALKSQQDAADSNLVKYERTLSAMKAILQKAEARFEGFQKDLKDQRVLVERIKKPGG